MIDISNRTEKRCSRCGEVKPTDAFVKDRRNGDERGCACTACTHARGKIYKEKHKDMSARYRKIHNENYLKEHGVSYAKTRRDIYNAKYPLRRKAREAVETALDMGILAKKPCEICGEIKVVGHHKNYLRPLDVQWLCTPCHRAVHVELRRAGISLNG